jgi:rubrerythrin
MSIQRRIPVAIVGSVALVVALAIAAGRANAATTSESKTPVTPAAPEAPAPPQVRDTGGNLLDAFDSEVNAKARYLAAAKVADQEGYAYVAGLFRACAQAEQVHSEQHVHAIAWTGLEAKAFLDKLAAGATAENLKTAIELETYEATQLYPAMIEKARAEHQSAAVRSMNYALGAEREHARLFTAALATLEERPAPRAFHVCSTCGKTVESLDFKKCPNCFSPAKKFIEVK